MKTRYVIGGIVALICVAVSFWLLSTTGVQYTSIAQAAEMKKRVSIKGHWLKDQETNYDSQKNEFSFTMSDDSSRSVKVLYHGSKPNNFELAESVVVKGKMENDIFVASDILTKCPSKYEGTNTMKEKTSL